jgi:hypothetical protein
VAFVKLGLTSFGGPIAHLGYFRDELVVRRKWLDEAAYAVVALLLPGMLLVYGTLPFWDATRARPAVQAAMRGSNAAVVGNSRCGPLQPGLDQCGLDAPRFCAGARGLPATHRLERAAMDRGRVSDRRRYLVATRHRNLVPPFLGT